MIDFGKKNVLYFIVFVFIYCTDTFIVFANTNTLVKIIFQALLGVVTIYIASKTKKYTLTTFLFFLVSASCVLCTMIIKQDSSNGNFIKIILLAIGMIVANGINFESFRKAFSDIISVFCAYSLVVFALSFFINDYGPLPVIKNVSNTRVVFAGLSNISLSYGVNRNFGPFWEPGVYSIYLSLAALFCLIDNQKLTKRVLLLMVGVITTLSTSGYVMIFLLILYYLFGNSKKIRDVKKNWMRYVVASALIISFLSLISYNDVLNHILFSKLNKNNFEYTSTIARTASIYGNIDIWLKNPFFGIGPTRLQEYYNQYLFSQGFLENSNTNGLLMVFSMYGTIFGLCVVLGIVKLALSLDETIIGKIVILALFICMFISEPLTTSCMFNIILFYGLNGDSYNGRMQRKNCN